MKKLYKTEENKQIAGVCQGLAEYFEIDPSLVRIAFVVAILFFSTGFWLYVIMAIILPDKREVVGHYQKSTDDIYEKYDDYDY